MGKILDDYIKDIDTRDSFLFSSYFILIVCAVLEFPLTLLNKIEKLRYFAFIGVSGIVVFVVALTITFFSELN